MITVEKAEQLVASSRPPRGVLQGSRPALLCLGMLLGAALAAPDLLARWGFQDWLLSQVVLFVLAAVVAGTAIRQRRQARLMLQGFEAMQLRQWDQARDALVSLLRHPIKHRQARAEALLALAATAEADHNYEASQRIYEALCAEDAADPIQLHTAHVALAAAMLRTGQTTDAVDLIDRLARVDLPGPLKAQVELLALFREVNMGQAADSIARAKERRELFRQHLSTRAGYGYGLLAAAFDHANQPERAGRYWHDATLLVRPKELIGRFEELAPVAAKYPAAEFAL